MATADVGVAVYRRRAKSSNGAWRRNCAWLSGGQGVVAGAPDCCLEGSAKKRGLTAPLFPALLN